MFRSSTSLAHYFSSLNAALEQLKQLGSDEN